MSKALSKYEYGTGDTILIQQEDLLSIPSRVLAINHIFGGGIPYGRIVEIAGEFSSGKTLLAIDFLRSVTKLGGAGVFIDAENALTSGWLIKNGLDPADIDVFPEVEIETIGDFIRDWAIDKRKKLDENQPILIVIDSIAALDSKVKFEENQMDAKAEMGSRAKALYKMIRVLNPMFAKLGISVIFINQIRMKLAVMFGSPETTPGGKAIEFFSTIRVAAFKGKKIEIRANGKKVKVGQYVSLRTWKNKIAPPVNPLTDIPVYFKETDEHNIGFGKYVGLMDILLEEEVIEKSGNTYSFDGDRLDIGKDKAMAVILADKELRQDILAEADINSIGRTREKLEDLTENLFPIGKYEKFL